jgi:hypothetical protein
MKKIIGILVALCLLFAFTFTVGCASKPAVDTAEQAVEADADGGYEEAGAAEGEAPAAE